VDATIDVTGTRLVITSQLGDTPMTIVSEDGGDTAESLGIFAPGVFETAYQIKQALLDNDAEQLSRLIGDVDESLSHIVSARASAGQKITQMSFARTRLLDMQLNLDRMRSLTEEADLTQVAIELVNSETLYQIALKTTVQMIQPTIFNFLR
jgi:flagellar hook-associated protein 3 FlgL